MTDATQNRAEVEDSLGRIIKIRKLNALDRLRLFDVLGADRSENSSYLSYAFATAAVTQIDVTPLAFPNSVKTLESNVDLLGDEGLQAVTAAYKENFAADAEPDSDEIKN